MTLLSKMQKLDDKSNSQLTLEMHMQQVKFKEACLQLLDHLIEDKKVVNEMIKESLELKPIEVTKSIWFILRSIYQPRFLGLVIKKF